ncbi:SHOCT domain-containing protein [Corynebacterium xerosis]|uniref:SHOCT domain-containing protein n=1 Tax=Corynebacterium xerosis TaxID=1725 RepID=A0ABV3UUR3_9CORY
MSSGSVEFDKLKKAIDSSPVLRREIEFAFSSLLTAANPTDRGLRFLFGGGAEWIIASAAWSAGVLTAPAGHNENGFDLGDLLDKSRNLWSVKASASDKAAQIRLRNFMGEGLGAVWNEPTLFVGPYLGGAVLIDPRGDDEMQEKTRHAKDALVLPGGVPKKYAKDHPAAHIAFDVEVNTGAANADPHTFIKSILDPAHFPHLAKPFLASEPRTANSNVDEIKKLVDLRDSGVLTEEQFTKAVDQLLS